MPTDTQPAISHAQTVRPPAHRRPGRPSNKSKRPLMALSRKVRAACDLMALEGLSRKEAATRVGLSDHSLYLALRNPVVLRYHNEALEVLRTGERGKSVVKIAHLRDNAASERVSLEAAKHLDARGPAGNGGVTVNVGVNVQPGYLVDVAAHSPAAGQILHQAGSTRNLLTEQQDVPDEA